VHGSVRVGRFWEERKREKERKRIRIGFLKLHRLLDGSGNSFEILIFNLVLNSVI
jgi:hypothetical protein